MGSVDCLKDIATSLDLFFKGLSDCGLLRTYTVEFLERNMLDIASRMKFKVVVHEFLSNMQKSVENDLVGEEVLISKDSQEKCMWIEELSVEDLAYTESETVYVLPNDVSLPPPIDVCEEIQRATDECTLETPNIPKSREPLEKVVHMMYSNKEESDLSEPWQLTILKNQGDDTTIDTITEVMTKNHMQDEKWRCDMCNKIFKKMQKLQEHCREEHNGTGCFECNLCGTRVMTKLSLKRHIRSHSGIKPNTCDICNKSFKRADYLTTHYKLHNGVRTHKCSLCGKEFTSKTNLQLHKRVHSGQKDYMCIHCNKSFTRRDKLRDHVLRHLNIKRFQCSVCDKKYAEKRDLRCHLKTHDMSMFL